MRSGKPLPPHWKLSRLGDICEVIAGQSPPSSTYRYSPEGLPFFQGKADFGKRHPIPKVWCISPTKIALAGDILISVRAPVGPTNVAETECCIGRGLSAIRPKNGTCRDYILHTLRYFERDLVQLGSGSTFEAITNKDLINFAIPLPPLHEQRRIAAILDKADAIRELRRQSITKLDTLLKAVFLEMFGDPVRNPKGWTTAQLGEVAEIASGAMKGRKFNGQATVLMPYLRVANVQDGFIDLREVKEIEVLATDIERYRLQPGDVLMTEGGDPDKLGRGAIWRGEIPNCLHQNHIFRVRPNHRSLLPEFLSGLIGSERGKRYFLREAKQTTGIATINMTQLRAFPVLLPPIELQQKYLKFVEMVQFLAIKITRSAEKHEELFRALQQRAFTGQLFTEKAAAAAQQELFAD